MDFNYTYHQTLLSFFTYMDFKAFSRTGASTQCQRTYVPTQSYCLKKTVNLLMFSWQKSFVYKGVINKSRDTRDQRVGEHTYRDLMPFVSRHIWPLIWIKKRHTHTHTHISGQPLCMHRQGLSLNLCTFYNIMDSNVNVNAHRKSRELLLTLMRMVIVKVISQECTHLK